MSPRLIGLGIVVGLGCSAAENPVHVSVDGFMRVRVGMTADEASNAYGSPLAPGGPVDADAASCFYIVPVSGDEAVSFMVVDQRIARIDVDGPGPRTSTGVGVGSTEAEVRAAYPGRVEVSPHKYTGPQGHYLTVTPREGFALIFETDGSVVTTYRAGRLPPVAYVEGCS